ncbi:RNA polymerase sigma factor (sigma-70 family) [Gracilibacillus halotolerans]|uniref:RNA polymerase sigma factor (Sigma-70 family) n=1 Tax=Gracilibacillus halotolerans TaxID=74386 RepID=A0A841RLS6_9BACI|nr:sigma-70 family RNA polymerase sigma factor [Gracilibacillus halotolerans]MBB6512837.1 RNA polymerase sigma factor (sigma-70 family) [Gracilibacillus halotolerans]
METFEEVVDQYKPYIYYFIRRYGIRDLEGEFFQLGMIGLWQAWENWDEDRASFSSYAYLCVRREMLRLLDSNSRRIAQQQAFLETVKREDFVRNDDYAVENEWLHTIRKMLTEKQWIWVNEFLIGGYSAREIAEKYGVSENAVKCWGRDARKKLKKNWNITEELNHR